MTKNDIIILSKEEDGVIFMQIQKKKLRNV